MPEPRSRLVSSRRADAAPIEAASRRSVNAPGTVGRGRALQLAPQRLAPAQERAPCHAVTHHARGQRRSRHMPFPGHAPATDGRCAYDPEGCAPSRSSTPGRQRNRDEHHGGHVLTAATRTCRGSAGPTTHSEQVLRLQQRYRTGPAPAARIHPPAWSRRQQQGIDPGAETERMPASSPARWHRASKATDHPGANWPPPRTPSIRTRPVLSLLLAAVDFTPRASQQIAVAPDHQQRVRHVRRVLVVIVCGAAAPASPGHCCHGRQTVEATMTMLLPPRSRRHRRPVPGTCGPRASGRARTMLSSPTLPPVRTGSARRGDGNHHRRDDHQVGP